MHPDSRKMIPAGIPWPDEVIFIYKCTCFDDAIMFVTDKSSSIKSELEKHKVDDVVTVDRQHNNNDIQRFEEEDKQLLSK